MEPVRENHQRPKRKTQKVSDDKEFRGTTLDEQVAEFLGSDSTTQVAIPAQKGQKRKKTAGKDKQEKTPRRDPTPEPPTVSESYLEPVLATAHDDSATDIATSSYKANWATTSHCAQTEDDWQSDFRIVRKSTPIVKQQHEAESYTSAHSGSSQTEASKSVRSAHEATKSMATRHVGRKLPKHRRWQSQQQSKILQGSVYDTTKVGCAKASCYPMSVNV